MMRPNYLARCDAANMYAAHHPSKPWNEGFLEGLALVGLALAPWDGEPLPADGPVFAPWPTDDDPDRWPRHTTLIVEAETIALARASAAGQSPDSPA